MKTKLICLASLMLLTAANASCAGGLQQITAGRVGCSPDDIVISNDDIGFGSRSWTAQCQGKTYVCSGGAGASPACTETVASR